MAFLNEPWTFELWLLRKESRLRDCFIGRVLAGSYNAHFFLLLAHSFPFPFLSFPFLSFLFLSFLVLGEEIPWLAGCSRVRWSGWRDVGGF